MVDANRYGGGKYLRASHISDLGFFWRIREVEVEEINEKQTKLVVRFDEDDRSVALNPTMINQLTSICGSSETDDWIGRKVVLYRDDNVEFKGQRVGGIRFRAPRPGSRGAVETERERIPPRDERSPPDEDIPF